MPVSLVAIAILVGCSSYSRLEAIALPPWRPSIASRLEAIASMLGDHCYYQGDQHHNSKEAIPSRFHDIASRFEAIASS